MNPGLQLAKKKRDHITSLASPATYSSNAVHYQEDEMQRRSYKPISAGQSSRASTIWRCFGVSPVSTTRRDSSFR